MTKLMWLMRLFIALLFCVEELELRYAVLTVRLVLVTILALIRATWRSALWPRAARLSSCCCGVSRFHLWLRSVASKRRWSCLRWRMVVL